ncbi:MAG: hypothetical protein ACKVPX_14285 [Myxococcaceae bacterium]
MTAPRALILHRPDAIIATPNGGINIKSWRLSTRVYDERDIGRLQVGARAYVTADAFGGERFSGKVAEIGRRFGRKNLRADDPVERNNTKMLETLIELDSNQKLVPDQRATSYINARAEGT